MMITEIFPAVFTKTESLTDAADGALVFFAPAMFQAGMHPAVVVLLFIVMILGFGLPLLLVAVTFTNWLKNRRLLRTGEPASAKILKIWDTGVSVNDNPQVGMLLEVYAEDRPVYRAETRSVVSRLDIPRVQVGAAVEVRFDREDPSRIALVM